MSLDSTPRSPKWLYEHASGIPGLHLCSFPICSREENLLWSSQNVGRKSSFLRQEVLYSGYTSSFLWTEEVYFILDADSIYKRRLAVTKQRVFNSGHIPCVINTVSAS